MKDTYRRHYPGEEKISKNPTTAACYRKIRECFRSHYIREKFDNPLCPRELEFLQWIKRFLNDMENKIKREGL